MMRLVQRLVDHRIVQSPVDPIDAQIREADEEGELKEIVQSEGSIRGCIVELSIALDFQKKQWRGEARYEWHGDHGLLDLEGDLVLEVFRVSEGSVVEDVEIGKASADEIDYEAKYPVNQSASCSANSGRHMRESVPCYQV